MAKPNIHCYQNWPLEALERMNKRHLHDLAAAYTSICPSLKLTKDYPLKMNVGLNYSGTGSPAGMCADTTTGGRF